eukprot:6214383-Pleurochrysis_carterae.AAC.2
MHAHRTIPSMNYDLKQLPIPIFRDGPSSVCGPCLTVPAGQIVPPRAVPLRLTSFAACRSLRLVCGHMPLSSAPPADTIPHLHHRAQCRPASSQHRAFRQKSLEPHRCTYVRGALAGAGSACGRHLESDETASAAAAVDRARHDRVLPAGLRWPRQHAEAVASVCGFEILQRAAPFQRSMVDVATLEQAPPGYVLLISVSVSFAL